MKFYVFANAPVAEGADLAEVKAAVATELERIKSAIEADAKVRAES